MSRRRAIWLVVALLVLAGAGAAAVYLDPAARVQGWVNSEPFFQGRSATAWRKDLRGGDEVTAAAARDALAAGKAAAVCGWVLRTAPEQPARSRAADALGEMGAEATPAAADLTNALADADPLVRAAAVRAVKKLGPNAPGAVPALVKLFPDKDAIEAAGACGKEGADALPDLLRLLKDDKPDVRQAAVRAVGRIGPAAASAAPEVLRLADADPDAGVRPAAAEAFGRLGPDAVLAVVTGTDPAARAAALRAIEKAPPRAPALLPELVRLFPEREAIRAVAAFKKDASPALPPLLTLLTSPDPAVRRQAVRAVGKIGPAAVSAVPEVIRLTESDPEATVQEQAAEALGDIGPAARAGVKVLVKSLRHKEVMVRRDAARALGQIGPVAREEVPNVLDEVRALTADPDERVKEAAARAAELIEAGQPVKK